MLSKVAHNKIIVIDVLLYESTDIPDLKYNDIVITFGLCKSMISITFKLSPRVVYTDVVPRILS